MEIVQYKSFQCHVLGSKRKNMINYRQRYTCGIPNSHNVKFPVIQVIIIYPLTMELKYTHS